MKIALEPSLQDKLIETRWPALAGLAGLAPEGTETRMLSSRCDEGGLRAVLRLDLPGGSSVILKHDGREAASDFSGAIDAQRMARLRLQGNLLGLRVPGILAELPDRRTVLMELAPGQPAHELMELAGDNHARRAILTACGRWLSGFHRAGRTAMRPYRTRFALDYLAERRARLPRGGPKEEGGALLMRLFDAVQASAADYDGRPVRHAQQHGNFTLGQVVIGADTVATVGFRPERTGPVGHDVTRFLVDYITLFGDHRKIAEGRLLSSGDEAAFFRGYDIAGGQDAAIGFLVGVQLIHEWLRLPTDPDHRGLVHSLRLAGLRETAMRLFPDLRAG